VLGSSAGVTEKGRNGDAGVRESITDRRGVNVAAPSLAPSRPQEAGTLPRATGCLLSVSP
jgi:hypothetical protein